jgi:hypothetical protein
MSFDALTIPFLGEQEGIPLEDAGPTCRAVARVLGEEPERARALLATMALQAFAHSAPFFRQLDRLGFPVREISRTERIVAVRSVKRRYDLAYYTRPMAISHGSSISPRLRRS